MASLKSAFIYALERPAKYCQEENSKILKSQKRAQ